MKFVEKPGQDDLSSFRRDSAKVRIAVGSAGGGAGGRRAAGNWVGGAAGVCREGRVAGKRGRGSKGMHSKGVHSRASAQRLDSGPWRVLLPRASPGVPCSLPMSCLLLAGGARARVPRCRCSASQHLTPLFPPLLSPLPGGTRAGVPGQHGYLRVQAGGAVQVSRHFPQLCLFAVPPVQPCVLQYPCSPACAAPPLPQALFHALSCPAGWWAARSRCITLCAAAPSSPLPRSSTVHRQAGGSPAAGAHRAPRHPQRAGTGDEGVCLPARRLLARTWHVVYWKPLGDRSWPLGVRSGLLVMQALSMY